MTWHALKWKIWRSASLVIKNRILLKTVAFNLCNSRNPNIPFIPPIPLKTASQWHFDSSAISKSICNPCATCSEEHLLSKMAFDIVVIPSSKTKSNLDSSFSIPLFTIKELKIVSMTCERESCLCNFRIRVGMSSDSALLEWTIFNVYMMVAFLTNKVS
mgnify:CR=1 FL=1